MVSHIEGGTFSGGSRILPLGRGLKPLSHRFAGCFAAVLALRSTRRSPSGAARGALAEEASRYLTAASDSARWKNRARPTIRRVTFVACVSESLNASFSSPSISSFPLPDRKR